MAHFITTVLDFEQLKVRFFSHYNLSNNRQMDEWFAKMRETIYTKVVVKLEMLHTSASFFC